MARDYYAEARAVGSRLAREGQPSWQTRIDDILLHGATGSEIMMGLRWVLSEVEAAGVVADPELAEVVAELRGSISSALGS